MIPPVATVRQDDTHRLVPARQGDAGMLERLADEPQQLEDLFALEAATNERLLGEANLLPGIGVHELLFGISYARIVNAAFCHAHPSGSRFNGPDRGAWYAAFELQTAQAEIAFLKSRELMEVNWREPETFRFDDYLADFRAEFHNLRSDLEYAACLDPDSCLAAQHLARRLLVSGSGGIVYPSVRASAGTCLACFRPALVTNVRHHRTLTLTFADADSPPVFDG